MTTMTHREQCLKEPIGKWFKFNSKWHNEQGLNQTDSSPGKCIGTYGTYNVSIGLILDQTTEKGRKIDSSWLEPCDPPASEFIEGKWYQPTKEWAGYTGFDNTRIKNCMGPCRGTRANSYGFYYVLIEERDGEIAEWSPSGIEPCEPPKFIEGKWYKLDSSVSKSPYFNDKMGQCKSATDDSVMLDYNDGSGLVNWLPLFLDPTPYDLPTLPKVDVKVKSRVLKARWSTESAKELNASLGFCLRDTLDVDSKAHKDLKNANNSLKSELNVTKTKIGDLQTQFNKVNQNYNTLKFKHDEQQKIISNADQNKANLVKQHQELLAAYEKLKKTTNRDFDDLKYKHDLLANTNHELCKRIVGLEEQITIQDQTQKSNLDNLDSIDLKQTYQLRMEALSLVKWAMVLLTMSAMVYRLA